jgi:hypothetical protein
MCSVALQHLKVDARSGSLDLLSLVLLGTSSVVKLGTDPGKHDLQPQVGMAQQV